MKRFLKMIALFLLPAVLLHGLVFAALVRSGELADTAAVADATARGEVLLFGQAYRDDTRTYKHAVASKVGADFLVLGTSRSMQFRSEFFEVDSFYNAGGSVPFLGGARHFLDTLPADKRPTQVLLVLDQYFYNETWSNLDEYRDRWPYEYTEVNPGYALRRMFTDAFDGKYNLPQVLATPKGVYGMTAAGKGAGFYADGSYSYGNAVEHPETLADAGFKDTLQRIALRTNRFETGDVVSMPNVEITEALLLFCAENNIKVTAILPPYAPTVWHTMQDTGEYGYMDEIYPTLQPLFAQYGFEIFDYSYLPETTDDQYMDGFHGSDRVYAALCARLAQDSVLLKDVLDEDALQAIFAAEGNPLTVSFES